MDKPFSRIIFRFMPLLWSLVLSGIIFYGFYIYSSSYLKKDEGSLAYLIEQVRTRNLKENTGSELRRISSGSERLDKKIITLSDKLRDSGENLSSSLKQEIIFVLGVSGRSALSLTSLMLSFLQANTEPAIIKESLLALKRLKSVRESIEQVLGPLCDGSVSKEFDQEVSLFACALLLARDGSIPASKVEEIDKLARKIEIELDDNFVKKAAKPNNNFAQLYYSLSMVGQRIEGLNTKLRQIISGTDDLEVKISLIQILRDNSFNVDDSDTIHFLSDLMQYDSEYRVREAALLALIGKGSEESLKFARNYGHKFLRGEVRPEQTSPHPFRAWALEMAEGETGVVSRP